MFCMSHVMPLFWLLFVFFFRCSLDLLRSGLRGGRWERRREGARNTMSVLLLLAGEGEGGGGGCILPEVPVYQDNLWSSVIFVKCWCLTCLSPRNRKHAGVSQSVGVAADGLPLSQALASPDLMVPGEDPANSGQVTKSQGGKSQGGGCQVQAATRRPAQPRIGE